MATTIGTLVSATQVMRCRGVRFKVNENGSEKTFVMYHNGDLINELECRGLDTQKYLSVQQYFINCDAIEAGLNDKTVTVTVTVTGDDFISITY